MSAEQLSGDEAVDPRGDVWALGCLLFEMLVARPPGPAHLWELLSEPKELDA